jgi:hypothetical protein
MEALLSRDISMEKSLIAERVNRLLIVKRPYAAQKDRVSSIIFQIAGT